MRFAAALLIALLLAPRLLTPAGFMPAFKDGAITVVACPDAAPAPISHHHHSGDHKSAHQPCPYAATSGLAATPDIGPVAPDLVLLAGALPLGRGYAFLEQQRSRERPPATGPPILA